ncbi:MAG: hypothetical protein LUQ71_10165 [Methanoregula sp.]|nr:hypothetical protein [Methanoregula sp.]
MAEDVSADILGLFYGPYNTAPGAAKPATDLVIKKSDLTKLGSSTLLVGRFSYVNQSSRNLTLTAEVYIDGEKIEESDGLNIKPAGQSGIVDVPVFEYPNNQAARAPGVHQVTIRPGLHKNVFGGQHSYSVNIPASYFYPSRTFTVTIQDA